MGAKSRGVSREKTFSRRGRSRDATREKVIAISRGKAKRKTTRNRGRGTPKSGAWKRPEREVGAPRIGKCERKLRRPGWLHRTAEWGGGLKQKLAREEGKDWMRNSENLCLAKGVLKKKKQQKRKLTRQAKTQFLIRTYDPAGCKGEGGGTKRGFSGEKKKKKRLQRWGKKKAGKNTSPGRRKRERKGGKREKGAKKIMGKKRVKKLEV